MKIRKQVVVRCALCRVEIHVHENSQTCLSSVADSHPNRDKVTNFETIILGYSSKKYMYNVPLYS